MDALQRLEQFYSSFDQGAGNLSEFMGRGVCYLQCQSMSERTMPRGPQAVALTLGLWRIWFNDVTIADRVIERLSPEYAKSVAGATECFIVRYLLGGRYVKRISNFRSNRNMTPLVLGCDVVLELQDRVWLAGEQIIEIRNLIRVISS